MPVISVDSSLDLARELSQPCLCNVPAAYCPAHGEYTPGVADQEIIVAFEEGRQKPVNARVIRKTLE